MVKKQTERGRLQQERIKARDAARELENRATKLAMQEVLLTLWEDYEIEGEAHWSEGRVVGIAFDERQACALLWAINELAEGRSPRTEK